MSDFSFPAHIEQDEDGVFILTFPDWDAGVTDGETEAEALAAAVDLLNVMISSAIEEGREIPRPSGAGGRPVVHPDPLVAAKAGLHTALLEAGISRAELGRRLGWHPPQVVRVLDPRHKSAMEQINQALAAVGKRLVISVQAA